MKPIFKEPPIVDKLPISSFIMHRKHYRIDKAYQRDSDVWESWMEAYLIDTILRGLSMPLVYIHRRNGNSYIVDGQQRINTINKFYHNKIELSERFSCDIIKANNYATQYKGLNYEYKHRFDTYPVNIAYLEKYADEEIRSMFRRLQSGKPLNPGEKLNSFAGRVIPTLRNIAKHKFFSQVTAYSASRHKHLFLAAQLLYLEKMGIDDVNTKRVSSFIDDNESMKSSNADIVKMKKTLNYLLSAFKENTGEIEKPGWIITIYLFVSHLSKNYSVKGMKKEIRDFYTDFYHKINNAPNTRNVTYNKFFEAVSKSTTSRKNIALRHKIITEQFIKAYKPLKLDENRLFSKKQKLEIYRRDGGRCSECNKKLKYNSLQTHYHHLEMHVQGGETEVNNGILVCKKCHLNKLHKNK